MKKKGVETYFNTFHLGREGFGPSKAEPTDLQSAPFDRSGTYPFAGYLFSSVRRDNTGFFGAMQAFF